MEPPVAVIGCDKTRRGFFRRSQKNAGSMHGQERSPSRKITFLTFTNPNLPSSRAWDTMVAA
mgnify:CR=1 FL=1